MDIFVSRKGGLCFLLCLWLSNPGKWASILMYFHTFIPCCNHYTAAFDMSFLGQALSSVFRGVLSHSCSSWSCTRTSCSGRMSWLAIALSLLFCSAHSWLHAFAWVVPAKPEHSSLILHILPEKSCETDIFTHMQSYLNYLVLCWTLCDCIWYFHLDQSP